MADFIEIPAERLEPTVLDALLEEFATRDGTDYGAVETVLAQRLAQLRGQLAGGEMALLYDADSEQWDLLAREHAAQFLEN